MSVWMETMTVIGDHMTHDHMTSSWPHQPSATRCGSLEEQLAWGQFGLYFQQNCISHFRTWMKTFSFTFTFFFLFLHMTWWLVWTLLTKRKTQTQEIKGHPNPFTRAVGTNWCMFIINYHQFNCFRCKHSDLFCVYEHIFWFSFYGQNLNLNNYWSFWSEHFLLLQKFTHCGIKKSSLSSSYFSSWSENSSLFSL